MINSEYPNYIETNNEIEPLIPEGWSTVNMRYVIDVLTDYTANGSFASLAKNVNYLESGYSRLIRLTDLRKNLQTSGIYVSKDAHEFLAKSTLIGGEILLANVGAYSGLAWVVPNLDSPSTLGPNMFLLKFKEDCHNRYVYYSLIANYLSTQLKNKAVSSAQPKLNKEDVRTCFFIKPSLKEQTQITKYLDYQTNIIDQLIEKKERLVELLKEQRQSIINEAVTRGLDPNAKMKDSGIEWLGEIPEEWETIRLKHLAIYFLSSVGRNTNLEDRKVKICHYPYAYKNEFIDNQTILDTGTCTEDQFDKFRLKEGQIIITKDSESADDIGVPCYIAEDIDNAICGYHLGTIECVDNQIEPEFLFRFLQSSIVSNFFELTVNGITRFGLGKSTVENLLIPLPSVQVQHEIIQKIKDKTGIINSLNAKVISQLEKLKEYRQSIISEAVTGKIDLREWQEPKKEIA
jgi:type I restriction enzyme S subunit